MLRSHPKLTYWQFAWVHFERTTGNGEPTLDLTCSLTHSRTFTSVGLAPLCAPSKNREKRIFLPLSSRASCNCRQLVTHRYSLKMKDLSRNMHTRTHSSTVKYLWLTTCNVNANERLYCSWLGNDQGFFPTFFKMDSDFFTFQLLNKSVCEPSLTTEDCMLKMSVFYSKVREKNVKNLGGGCMHIKLTYQWYLLYI